MSDDEGGCGGFDDLGGDDRELVDAQDAVDLDEDPLTVVAGVLRESFWVFLLLVSVAKIGRYLGNPPRG